MTIRAWSRIGSSTMLLAVAGFVVLTLWAKHAPIQAQQAEKKAPAKKVAKKSSPPVAVVPGKGVKLDAQGLAKLIDQEVRNRLKADNLPASALSDDAEFLRRVYLDLTGVIPSADQVIAFLESKDPNKRAKAIDELLGSPRFGRYLAEIWSGLMLPRESNNRRLDHTPLQKWMADSFNANKPLNQFVYELVTASGDQDENGAVTYFVGNPTVDKMTDNISRMFLGVQLQCAQCHNHPFVDWKQTEYWGMASFFMKVRLTVNPQQAAKKGIAPGISEVAAATKGKKTPLPESAKIVPAKFLQAEEPKLDKSEPFRPVLAKWLTSAENQFFAQAMVNRFWYQLFGRGLVNPVDDMHEENAASHPALLAALTEQFKSSGFDLKHLLRAICNSEAYQRTSRPLTGNESDNELYSHMLIRVLTAEQLYDSLAVVIGQGRDALPRAKAAAAKKGPANTPRDQFLAFFRIDEGADPLEYQQGIPQALRLMNSPQMNATNGPVATAMEAGKAPAQVIERIYLMALSRRPSEAEMQRFILYVNNQTDPRAAYGDIMWALLNSSEFTFNH